MTYQTATDEGQLWTLEAWRGLAAWMVVYAHFWPFAGWDVPLLRFAFTGVDLFFVISGFVFAPYLLGRPLHWPAFGIRRFFRIYPAYLTALLIYVALKLLAGEELKYLWQHLLFFHLQSREMTFFYNPAFWSLPAEVEFYLLLPLLAGFTQGKVGRVVGLLALAWLLRLGLGYLSDAPTGNQAFIWMHHLPGMLVEFLLGTVAWWSAQNLSGAWVRLCMFGIGVLTWLALSATFAHLGDEGLHASPWLRGQISWLAALAFALMVAASAHAWPHAPSWLQRTSIGAGQLSYGVYLLHFGVLRLFETYGSHWHRPLALAAACTLLLSAAWLLFKLWENPWRVFGRRWAMRLVHKG